MVKIERSFPAPKSLEYESKNKSGSYSREDVIRRLKEDFHNKCYICEIDNLQDPVVEHLMPHKNGKYPERKFMWDNLFWACGHCNGIKNQKKYDEGILDCCKEDPELFIDFNIVGTNVIIVSKGEDLPKVKLTVDLVQEVFNVKNTGMRVYKSEHRLQELLQEMSVLYRNLEELQKKPDSKVILGKLKALLRRESRFAAFKRSYIRNNQEKYMCLVQYIR